MLEFADLVADSHVPALIADARSNGRDLLGHEIERLITLRKVNPGVRDDEIEFFQARLDRFESALGHARLRLDAVRVIVAL
jgi:ATP-dependent helicase HepA